MIKDTFKDIPKYILEKIKKKDLIDNPEQNGKTRFYSYLTKFKKQLIRVTVAVRNYRKKWLCKQVVLHGIHSDKCYLKDIVFYKCSGYQVGWYQEGISKYQRLYNDGTWGWNDDKYFNIFCPIINKEFINKFPEYKYSAIELYEGNDILNYLRLYEKYPHVEYLTKAGMQCLATSKIILNKCSKDKQFCKWLLQNKNELKHCPYYLISIINAYKQNKSIKQIDTFERFKKCFEKSYEFTRLRELITKNEKPKFLNYLIKQETDGFCYKDYLKACDYLKLDMSLDKNRYPHNFKFWHDTRINQYHTQKAIKDKKERKELYEKFKNVAEKYLSLQRNLDEDFVVVIAKSPAELIREGEILNHCVGYMGYDQKFVKEESLIFFIRNKDNIDTPFVTMEYSLKSNRILQCYAEDNTKPQTEVQEFVNKKWLPYAKRKLKALVA